MKTFMQLFDKIMYNKYIFPTVGYINSHIEDLLYIKLCWGRMYSHFGIIASITQMMLMVSVFLKTVFGNARLHYIIPFGIFGMIVLTMIGHIDIQKKIADREASLINRYNPEIRMIAKYCRENIKEGKK